MKTTIIQTGDHPTIAFAAKELSRYLRLAGTKVTSRFVAGDGTKLKPAAGEALLQLGLCEDLGLSRPAKLPPDDDWIRIEPQGSGYLITGANPRSVLFAAYRYLHELGFRWIRPGSRGQIIPALRSPLARKLKVDETPSYRYRTICIEGACSFEHVRDLIDWMAKQGMNGYFLQFHYGTQFFKRWYDHQGSTRLKPEPFEVEAIVASLIDEIKKRDMRFERMGHGWTCAALGIPGEGWEKSDELPSHTAELLAQVNGKREFWGGVPLNTNLCYSNEQIRRDMTDAIVAYARSNPQVDLVHFWLADGSNNHCECEGCKNTRPADFFVRMLNDLDAKLSAAGLATRIVFLIYVDLLWAPSAERLANQSRFTLMFAPITRSYMHSFLEAPDTGEKTAPFVRNKLPMPRNAQVNVQYLRQWQQTFKGDGFDFDYHAIWACYYDPSMYTMARTLHKDIQQLRDIGLDGLNSCQNQRMSFPHNLLLDVMARTLWNRKISLQKIVSETFADAFGKEADKVAEFFRKVSKLWEPFFEPVYHQGLDEKRRAQGLKNMPRLRELVDAMRPLAKRRGAQSQDAVQWSWRYLQAHLDLLDKLMPMMQAYLQGDPTTRALYQDLSNWLWKQEKTLHPALDVHMMVGVLGWRANELEEHLKKQAITA